MTTTHIHGVPAQGAIRDRLVTLHEALGDDTRHPARDVLRDRLEARDLQVCWLALSVLTGQLPTVDDVLQLDRAVTVRGSQHAVMDLLDAQTETPLPRTSPSVSIGEVTVDLAHTLQTPLATGIQRVVRESVRRWAGSRQFTCVAWNDGYTAMRQVPPPEWSGVDTTPVSGECDAENGALVPWQGRHIVPELAAEPERSARLEALARFSGCRVCVIGYDMVPVSTAETVAPGMSGVFARYLAAVRHYHRVAAISEAAAEEYRGWRDMLPVTGLDGPDVRPIPLPVEAVEVGAEQREAARHLVRLGGLPTVLVVGSHEPRKNHLAVLHAAELLWREGHQFFLLFIGGNAWRGERFARQVEELRRRGRPLETLRSADESVLWSAYREARFLVFASLNEGFGLPVAEALSVGTPVLTSNFGSLAEIAAGGGALTVDPRDDDALLAGMRRLLTDDALVSRLATQALSRPSRTWDDYANEVWEYFCGDSVEAPDERG